MNVPFASQGGDGQDADLAFPISPAVRTGTSYRKKSDQRRTSGGFAAGDGGSSSLHGGGGGGGGAGEIGLTLSELQLYMNIPLNEARRVDQELEDCRADIREQINELQRLVDKVVAAPP